MSGIHPVPYREGDWFALPLGDGGYAVGVIARISPTGVLFGYFFGPRRQDVPSEDEITDLSPNSAVLVTRFGDAGLESGTWHLLGSMPGWDRDEWPMPSFGRFEELTGRAFAVRYPSDDPNAQPRERLIEPEDLARFPSNDLYGHGAVEIRLNELLG